MDKKGKVVKLRNSPRIEVNIKDRSNKSHIFYFDTINLQDSTFTGMNSRAFANIKSMPYGAIAKVKLQNGHKNYKYADSSTVWGADYIDE